jgi:transcriptional regulator NrdR family protein
VSPKLQCPYCGEYLSKVIDSRAALDGKSVCRRRRCEACRKTYGTAEVIDRRLSHDRRQKVLHVGMQPR